MLLVLELIKIMLNKDKKMNVCATEKLITQLRNDTSLENFFKLELELPEKIKQSIQNFLLDEEKKEADRSHTMLAIFKNIINSQKLLIIE